MHVRAASLLAVLAALAAVASAGDPPPDAIDTALAAQGLTRRDAGWQARGTWEGYPCDIPYKLRHFDDLLAEPFATIPWTRAMGASVREFLSPDKLAEKGVRGSGSLMRAVHALGINRRFGAMRAYSANLTAKPTPLDQAILEVYRAAGRPSRFVTFGTESPYPLVEKPLAEAAAKLPKEISEALGQLVLNLVDAHRWADLAFRNVPMEKRLAVSRRLDLGAEEVDAIDYEPAVDDVARTWDEASLWYASMKTVQALDDARIALTPLAAAHAHELKDHVLIDHETPWGRIYISGTGNDTCVHEFPQTPFLVVDLGGDGGWEGRVGASDGVQTLGAMLDLGGNDRYITAIGGGGTGVRGAGEVLVAGGAGSGICGVGVVVDASGNDFYLGEGSLTEGAGQFGFGALIDLAGDDVYDAHYESQGAAFFGVGLLFDCSGKDRYSIWSDGQGFGGAGGVGVLADRSGDDKYEALRDPAVTKRPSYHQLKDAPLLSVSNAQGCAMGRRGDGADGHSWAGGLGALLDADGNDTYSAANWAQGTGYWFGTGVLWDGAGDDAYAADWWCSGSGAHFCIGALVDEAGNDSYVCRATNGIAFGHDFTLALLCDLGGNDRYECPNDVVARSINRSVAMLLDAAGDDVYRSGATGRPGAATFDAKMLDRRATSVYWTEPTSIGLFVDAGGKDDYGAAASDAASPARDSASWTDAPGSDNTKARNFGIGLDTETPLDADRVQGGKR